MQTIPKMVARTQGSNTNAEPLKLTKRIGSTTYKVNVYQSVGSNEKPEDKILRLIKREVDIVA